MRMNEQIARDAEVARIHAEEEIQGMIDSLDKSNETVTKYLQEYQQFALDLSLEKKIELIKEAPESKAPTEEVSKDKIKEMMQLVPVEDVYVQALQVKHPIIDWKVHSEGDRNYWQIIRLGGSTACYKFFVDLLRQLDREDLNQLWALVKEGRLLGIKCTRHSHWQYKFLLPVEGVPTARRMEIPLPGVCTAMMKKLPTIGFARGMLKNEWICEGDDNLGLGLRGESLKDNSVCVHPPQHHHQPPPYTTTAAIPISQHRHPHLHDATLTVTNTTKGVFDVLSHHKGAYGLTENDKAHCYHTTSSMPSSPRYYLHLVTTFSTPAATNNIFTPPSSPPSPPTSSSTATLHHNGCHPHQPTPPSSSPRRYPHRDDIELLLHHDPSIPKMIVVSILVGFTDEPPLEENDDLFDLESKEIKWKKILYDVPIDDLITEDKIFDRKAILMRSMLFLRILRTVSMTRREILDGDDDDYDYDKESIISMSTDIFETTPSIVITTSPLVLPIEDPEDSLIMGNEELNTILEKESDEFIKFSVEDLVLILSKSEDTSGSESVCILHLLDDLSPIDVPEEKAVTFSNSLFNSNDNFISSDDESLSDEDILKDNSFLNDDIFHHDPFITAMSVASILEGLTDEPPLNENDDLFDLKSKNDEWKKILITPDLEVSRARAFVHRLLELQSLAYGNLIS
nr:hypothetical protein [Tanacetum cinerariifolium]